MGNELPAIRKRTLRVIIAVSAMTASVPGCRANSTSDLQGERTALSPAMSKRGHVGDPPANPDCPASSELKPTNLPVFVDPAADLAAREDRENESWYVIAHVNVGEHRYGFMVHYMSSGIGLLGIAASAVSITDETTGHYFHSDVLLPARWGLSDRPGVDIQTENITLVGDVRCMTLHATVPEGEINVKLRPVGHVLYNMGTGYFPMFGDSAYANYEYAFPTMDTTGTLTLDGVTGNVQGQSWLDHQWGALPLLTDQPALVWTWMGMTLDDGSSISLWRTGDTSTNTWATVLRPDGTHVVAEASLTADSTDTWTSPETGYIYPTRWAVTIPGLRATLAVTATAENQERLVPGPGLEGSAAVTGTWDDRPITGATYVEVVAAQ